MTIHTKTLLSFLGRVALSAALLWYLSTRIDMGKTATVLQTADRRYLGFAFATFFSTNIIILIRWFIFIRALDLQASAWSVVRYFFAGLFGNLFLPSSIGGDLIKILGLCKDSSQKPRVVASVLLDRLSGFVSIVLVASGAFLFGFSLIEEKSLAIPIAAISVGLFLFGSILFNERIYEFCCRIFNKLPRVKKSLMDMHYDIALLKGRKEEGIKAVGLSCLSQLIFAFTYFLIAKALHQNVDLIYFFIFVPLLCVASAFPSIGGLGVREAGAAYFFGKVGMDTGVAVSLSLINFLFMVIMGLLGGLFYVTTISSRRVQYHSPNAGIKGTQT